MARLSKKNFFTFMNTPEFKQNWFDLGHSNSGSCNMGHLVPVLVEPTLPGDYFTCKLSYLLRMAQMVAPPMTRIGVSFFPFYCPNRILMDSREWDKFLSDVDGTSGVSLPTLSFSQITTVIKDSLLEKMGDSDSPVSMTEFYQYLNSQTEFIEALSLAYMNFAGNPSQGVYQKIEFSSDYQNNRLLVVFAESSEPIVSTVANLNIYVESLGVEQYFASWLKYYFSKFLGSSPFVGTLLDYMGFPVNSPLMNYEQFLTMRIAGTTPASYFFEVIDSISPANSIQVLPLIAYLYIWNEYFRQEYIQEEVPEEVFSEFNLWKDMLNRDLSILWKLKRRDWEHDYLTSALPSPQLGESSSIQIGDDGKFTIPELREANVIQRIREKLLHGGSRIWEILSNFFNERVADSRIQKPEFIVPMNNTGFSWLRISDIYQTAPGSSDSFPTIDADANIAAPRGASANTNRLGLQFNFKAEEHGYIIVLMNIQPEAVYSQGLPKHWTFLDPLDYGWPDFANLTEQPVYDFEVYATPSNMLTDGNGEYPIFGYQPQYASYKFHNSELHGELRDDLDFFHFGRIFAGPPSLNSQFLECNPSDRPFPLSYEYDKLTYHLAFDLNVNRRLPYYGIPSLR